MTRKQLLVVGLIVVAASTLSALVAYRRALRERLPGLEPAGNVRQPTDCVDFRDVALHVGETGCVSGRVLRVYTSRSGNTFLDFCADYRSCPFASVVFASDQNKFGNLQKLTGRVIEIRGAITAYQGRAEIIIRDPDQIRATR